METRKTKRCPRCYEELPIENFYLKKSGARLSWCRECTKAYARKDKVKNGFLNQLPVNRFAYTSDGQRLAVWEILKVCGWKRTEDNIWYKKPLKDENGMWNYKIVEAASAFRNGKPPKKVEWQPYKIVPPVYRKRNADN